MRKPLKPIFVNERARQAEHMARRRHAAMIYGVNRWLICPDCYSPARLCIHRPLNGRGDQFGRGQ